MSPYLIICLIAIYFAIIFTISYISSKGNNINKFYKGNNNSPWWVVAIGMIGTTLSGVTFISVPGLVSTDAKMTYFEVILGNFLGYIAIMYILLPLYYKMNLTSIYGYIEQRFGKISYKTSALLFLISKLIGAGFRLFIVILVLQITVFDPLHLPLFMNAIISVMLIWAYTIKGGIKSIIWTDMIQTFFLIFAVCFTIFSISKELNMNFSTLVQSIYTNEQFKLFDFSNFWTNENNFFKQFISGAFITIVMTGLDQDMMQKNLSLRNIHEAKKNFFSFSLALIPVNFIFLCLGVLFVIYINTKSGIPAMKPDEIYPILATKYLPYSVTVFFILGIIASAFSSANSAMIAMTTSFMIDIYNNKEKDEAKLKNVRNITHTVVALSFICIILLFNVFNDESIVKTIFKFAGYTYGPLLGLFFIGLFTKWKIKDKNVPYISLISIILTILIDVFSEQLFFGYKFGFEILILNGIITITGLYLSRVKPALN